MCSNIFQYSGKELRHADLCLRPRKTNLRRRNLKRNAVPTKNLPTGTHENIKKKERRNLTRYDPVQQPIVII